MSNAILDAILASAARTGANVVKDVVTSQLGPTLGGVAGTVVDSIAGRLGVPPEQIPQVPSETLDPVVEAVDRDPAVVRLQNESQRMMIGLMRAEMEKSGEAWWTWAWRPAWMWLLGCMWLWETVILGIVNSITGATIPHTDYNVLFGITAIYTGFYMGGHTVKNVAQTRWGR
ncbi:hypothetical protein ABE527_18280 [Brucella sp. TWI432]